jgi:hypothetical protein
MSSGPNGAAQLGVQRLDGIRSVDDPPHAFREGEEGDNAFPVAALALRDRRILYAPRTLRKGLERGIAGIRIGRAIIERNACTTPLRSFHEAKSIEWRMRWTMQV